VRTVRTLSVLHITIQIVMLPHVTTPLATIRTNILHLLWAKCNREKLNHLDKIYTIFGSGDDVDCLFYFLVVVALSEA